MRRTTPLSDDWGYDRGTPIDRYYVDKFLARHREDIRGRVLEVKDRRYTDRFGSNVDCSEILDINSANRDATIIADLTAADVIPSESFDCFILTQTLHFIYDFQSAVAHTCRILRPEGVLLATVPATIRVEPGWIDRDYWRFTTASCWHLFGGAFGRGQTEVRSYGNVLSGAASLFGLSAEELSRSELDAHDEYFPLIIAIRAVRL